MVIKHMKFLGLLAIGLTAIILTSILYFSSFSAESDVFTYTEDNLRSECFDQVVSSDGECVNSLYSNLTDVGEDASSLFSLAYTFEVSGISGGTDKGMGSGK